MSSSPGSSHSPAGPQRLTRGPKACEPCRLRKVKCFGGVPCGRCRAAQRVDDCQFRARARPNRSVSTKFRQVQHSTLPNAPHRIDRRIQWSSVTNADESSALVPPVPPVQPILPNTSHTVSKEPGHQDDPGIFEDEASAGSSTQVPQVGIVSDFPGGAGPVYSIERMMADWCDRKGLDPDSTSFTDCRRLTISPLPTATSPPPCSLPTAATEPSLMSTFICSPIQHVDVTSRTRVQSLYTRYIALPSSIREDECALIHACLCRAADMRAGTACDTREKDAGRGDGQGRGEWADAAIWYFNVTRGELDKWNRPSLFAVSALLYLVSFAAAHGGQEETLVLMKQIAWQIKQLGLEKGKTARLYAAEEQVGRVLTSFVYIDSMVATLVDQPACLPWSIIDYDPHSNSLIPPPSLFVMRLEGQFLDQVFTSFSSELSDPIGVLSTESPWSDFLRTAQQLHVSAGSRHSFLGWALIRVNWLNIIHRAPLVNHPLLAASSWSIIARAASHILRVYYDLAITDSLYPCWVQLRRIVICTQLAVLTCDHGHLHQVEAGELLSIGIELVRRHEIVWETARSTRIGLESARDRLLSSVYGVVVGPQMATVLQDAVSSEATRPMLPIHLHQTDPDQGVVTDITAPSSIDNNVSHGNGTWHSGFGDWQELGIDWPELWTGAMSDMKEVTVSGAAAGQLAQVNLDELFGV